jgi:hypothetical protein
VAAQAGAIASFFGSFRQIKEGDMFTMWPPCRTGRTAVDLGGAYSENELSVEASVFRDDRLPESFICCR